MTAMRELGFGLQALAIFHQLDDWGSGSVVTSLARSSVDEINCFGTIEWKAARKAAAHVRMEAPKLVAPRARGASADAQGSWSRARRRGRSLGVQLSLRHGCSPNTRAVERKPSVNWCPRPFRNATLTGRARSEDAEKFQFSIRWTRETHWCSKPT